jgi:methionine-rich copper-binding protein CopC
MMRRFLVLLSVLLATLGLAPAALAHAMLDHAEPRVGNTVPTPPHELKLWFTQNLEPAFTKVSVTNASGQRVDAGKPQVDGNEITVPLRSIGPGIYRVRWHVVSTDTHTTEGNFTFSVGK